MTKVHLLWSTAAACSFLCASARAQYFQNTSYSGYVQVTDQLQTTGQNRTNYLSGGINSNMMETLSDWDGAFGNSIARSSGESTTGNVDVVDNGKSGSYSFNATLDTNLQTGDPGMPTLASSYSLSANTFTFTLAGTNLINFSVLGTIQGQVGANSDAYYSIALTTGSNTLYSDNQNLQNGLVNDSSAQSLLLGPGTYTLKTHIEAQNFYIATSSSDNKSLGTTIANLNYGFTVVPAPEPSTLVFASFGCVAILIRQSKLKTRQ